MNAGDHEAPGPHAAWAFFVDFDGTITDVDGFDALVRHFAGDDAWNRSECDLAEGRQTLREALARQTSYVRGSFEDVYAFHERAIALDPTFAPFVERCEAAGIAVSVLSSGIAPLIERRLAVAGLGRLRVIAAGVEIGPESWSMRFRDASPNGTDKAACVRVTQAAATRVAFAGDGQSDFEAARAADVRYAKRGRKLERYLRELGVAFTPFDSFAEIAPPTQRA